MVKFWSEQDMDNYFEILYSNYALGEKLSDKIRILLERARRIDVDHELDWEAIKREVISIFGGYRYNPVEDANFLKKFLREHGEADI